MRSLKYAIIIFIVCTAAAIASLLILNYYHTSLKEPLEAAIEYAEKGEIEKAKEEIEKFHSRWENYDPILTAIVRHHTIDDIEKTGAGLKDLLEEENLAFFYSETRRTITLIDIMWKDEKVSLENFF